MLITLKNKEALIIDDFIFKCSIGKSGIKTKKIEGDKTTPRGKFSLGKLYYRADKVQKPLTKIPIKIITKNMGWCNDPNDKKYNKEFNLRMKKKGEKLFRRDHKYDAFIAINYNTNPVKPGAGSAIFLHLTKNYKPTSGCIAIDIKSFLFILKFIKTKTKIKIG